MKAFHLLLALFLLNANIFAQQELSLSQAIETGLQNNYQIQISEARADITANSNDWGVAGRYPTINLTLNSNNSYRDLSNPGSVLRTSNTINTGLAPGVEANWTIFNGYRVRYTKEQLEVQEQLSGGDIRIAVENTIQGVIQAYYNALVQQEQLDVVQEVLELSRDRVEYQELRKEFGQASTFDILQTQDAYLNDSTSYILQGNTFQTAIRNLNLSMGVDDLNTPYRLTDTLTYDVADYQLENLQERMQASNNQLQNQFVNRDLAALNTRIQESTLYPTVQVRSGLTYDVALSTGEQQFSFEM